MNGRGPTPTAWARSQAGLAALPAADSPQAGLPPLAGVGEVAA